MLWTQSFVTACPVDTYALACLLFQCTLWRTRCLIFI